MANEMKVIEGYVSTVYSTNLGSSVFIQFTRDRDRLVIPVPARLVLGEGKILTEEEVRKMLKEALEWCFALPHNRDKGIRAIAAKYDIDLTTTDPVTP